MKLDKRKIGATILAWFISLLVAMPLAALVGGFAGWAMGAAAGEWLEYAGVRDALTLGGQIGGLLGAFLCPICVLWNMLREDPRDEQAHPAEGSRKLS